MSRKEIAKGLLRYVKSDPDAPIISKKQAAEVVRLYKRQKPPRLDWPVFLKALAEGTQCHG
jgi:hypothetical protein